VTHESASIRQRSFAAGLAEIPAFPSAVVIQERTHPWRRTAPSSTTMAMNC